MSTHDRTIAEQRAYDEGVLAQRLNGFDAHFAIINGSIEKTAVALQAVALAVTELRVVVETRTEGQKLGLTTMQARVGLGAVTVAAVGLVLRTLGVGG